jgi:type IV pilus assembly protein PilO
MEDFFRQLQEFSIVKLLLAGLVIVGLTYYLMYQFLIKEDLNKVTKLSEQVDGLDTQIMQQQRKARELPKLRKKVEELGIQLDRVSRELPEKREIPQLLATVSDLAKSAGLEVSSFKPRGESYRDFYAEVPVDVEVLGRYHQVASFFDEVANLDRIVNIGTIQGKIHTAQESDVALKVNFVATTFRYLDDDERASVQERSGTGSKRRRK